MVGPSLQFSHVSLQLGAQDILSDVSLTLAGGQVHAIVGPNGGGKTSLVRALLGQMPFTGEISIDGAHKPLIGYAPQSLDLDRTLPFTVLDVLAVMQQRRPAFLGRSSANRQEQDDLLERVRTR
ncbi:MAG: ATP-binding cassette domain-containing protein, partial [Alphaproteobacteria bacterium]|nr:ATP-binding cassette domain-containing protein [Alphaproteobacteria bacterium]